MMSYRVVFLYTEIADYFLKCVEHFVQNHDAQVLIIRWPVKDEAPFSISVIANVDIHDKSKYSFKELDSKIREFNPDLIYSAGWRDKEYMKITRKFYAKIPTVLGYDNIWNNSLKQKIASLISPFYIKKIFSDVWTQGNIHVPFAIKLGFDAAHTHFGFYCCNTPFYEEVYTESVPIKSKEFPTKIIFCARYVKWKGIYELWQAFMELQKEQRNEWELWCLGTGEEYSNKVEFPGIKHFGFIQPESMKTYLEQTGVYILPSHFEPWGVTVHEFAAAGFPLILSRDVGAGDQFLIDEHNGFLITEPTVANIKVALTKLFQMNSIDLLMMGEHSHKLSQSITHQTWAKTLMDILSRN